MLQRNIYDRKILAKVSEIVLLFIIVKICVVPIIRASYYTVFYADDYSFALADMNPFRMVIKNYFTWQGTYSALYLIFWFNPLKHGGFAEIRALMIVLNILLFGTIMIFVYLFLKKNNDNNIWSCMATLVFAYLFTQYHFYTEIYTWFTGMMIYGVPLVFTLWLCVVLLLQKNDSIERYILGIVLSFVAAGGNLMVSGFLCYVLLVFLIRDFIEKKIFKLEIVTFISSVVFSAVNAFAPGHFVRHNVIDSTGMHVGESIKESFRLCIERIDNIFKDTDIVVAIIILFIIIILLDKCEKITKGYIISSIALLLLPLVTLFPLCLGYSKGEIPDRGYFVLDLSIMIAIVNLAVVAGILIKETINESNINFSIAMLIILAVSIITVDNVEMKDFVFIKVDKQLDTGQYQQYYQQVLLMTDKLEHAERGSDFELSSEDIPYPIDYIQPFWISDDKTNWVNVGVAEFYGLKSLRAVE